METSIQVDNPGYPIAACADLRYLVRQAGKTAVAGPCLNSGDQDAGYAHCCGCVGGRSRCQCHQLCRYACVSDGFPPEDMGSVATDTLGRGGAILADGPGIALSYPSPHRQS